MSIKIEWQYTGGSDENIEFSRVLYAYLHPKTGEILYIGKADRCTVRIPEQTGHAFHGKLDSHSRANWTLIPRQTGQ